MFQKFIVALSFIAASATAFAGDTVKVMYVGIPQVGPAISFIQSYAKNLPIDSKFVSMKDCELAMKEVENSDDVIYLISSTNTITSIKHNIECVPKFKPEDLIFTSYSYFDYCQKAGSKKDIFKERINIGAASIVPMDGMAKDLNANNGTRFVSVPYSSSVAVTGAIINDDIDWGFLMHSIAQPLVDAGKLECPYTSDPRSPKYVAKSFRVAQPNFEMDYMMAVKTSNPKIRAAAIQAAQSKGFGDWLKAGGFDLYKTSEFSQKDIDRWNKMNAETINNYMK